MLLYVAGKYSGETPEDVDANIAEAEAISIALWEMGHYALCPHKNTSQYERKTRKVEYQQYLAGDIMMMVRCDGLVMVPNWEDSSGARAEYGIATEYGLPVYIWGQDAIPPVHPVEDQRPEQCEMYWALVGRNYRTLLDKSADYGPNPFLGTGTVGIVSRAWEKVCRLMELTGFRFTVKEDGFEPPQKPKNEDLAETFLDGANIFVIGEIVRAGKWGR